jgi:hypothetical protein
MSQERTNMFCNLVYTYSINMAESKIIPPDLTTFWSLVLPFVSSCDLAVLAGTCKSLREEIKLSFPISESLGLSISTRQPDLMYIHPGFSTWELLQHALRMLSSCEISFDLIEYV